MKLIVLSLALAVRAQANVPGVIAPGAAPELVREGFSFTEGPLGESDGSLLFTDIFLNNIYRLSADGSLSVLRDNSGGANGLAFDMDGSLIAAEYGDGKRISRRSPDGSFETVTDNADGRPFLAPNDLIADSRGGIYFTDPGPRPVVPGRPVHVYYLPRGGRAPMVLDDTLPRPNGLTLTRDERALIVADTIRDEVYVYEVRADGTAGPRRVFARLPDVPAGQESGADGVALDAEGRVYVACRAGVQVFDGSGAYLGGFKLPRTPANLAFAGPGKRVLYITARQGVYRIETLTRGVDRPGK